MAAPSPPRRKVSGQNKNQLSFIKANTNSITDQLDTLKSVKQRYEIGKNAEHWTVVPCVKPVRYVLVGIGRNKNHIDLDSVSS